MASVTGWRGRNPVLDSGMVPPEPAESLMLCSSRRSSRLASLRAERARPDARVAATSAGTNVLALTVPQPLATSNPGAAVKPCTRTCPVSESITELFPLTTSEIPACVPSGPRMSYSTGLIGPRFRPWLSWVASASTPATMGADSDVPDWASIVMSGTERHREPRFTLSWYDGRPNTAEKPAPSEKMPPTCQIGSGPSLLPSVLLTFGTVPPTAVTHGLSSHVAVAGPGLVVPHWALAIARFCTTPQSPVAFSTGMPAAAAASGPGSLAWICAVPKA